MEEYKQEQEMEHFNSWLEDNNEWLVDEYIEQMQDSFITFAKDMYNKDGDY